MKICIVKLSAMGDIIHAMVALQFIKKQLPNVKIDWIVEETFCGVLENNPYIDNILPVNLKSLKKSKWNIFDQIKLIKNYGKNNYDVVIDAQGLIKSAIVSKIVGGRVVGSVIAGFDKDSIREKQASWFYDKKISISYSANTIDRNTTVISHALDFHISEEDIINKKSFLFYKDEDQIIYEYLQEDQKNVIFVIGSTWESRNYPKEKFAQIAESLKENCLIIWGNEEERQKAIWIEQNTQYAKVLPKVNFNSLKALIAASDLVIGNDTGPTHMAWGCNIPSITIFGPTPVNRVYQTSINKVVKSDSKVDHFKLNKNDFSIRDIDEQLIINIAKSLLNG